MNALDKVLRLSGSPAALPHSPAEFSGADELVAAAASSLEELRVLLSGPKARDDNDGDETDGDNEETGGSHDDHAVYQKLVKQGKDKALARKLCAQSDRHVKASALCEAAIVALTGLDRAPAGWTERTALDTWTVALAGNAPGDGKLPYGSGEDYADPGYRNGVKRYPLTRGGKPSQERIRAAWSYINHPKNAGEYNSGQLAKIKAKIKAAASKADVEISDDGEKVAATMVALAAKQADMMAAEAHPPFHGVHSHKHVHHGDNMHGGNSDRVPMGVQGMY